MFRRHRSDPDPTTDATFRDRLDMLAVLQRTEAKSYEPGNVRGRLGRSGSALLRDRLRPPELTAPQR